MRDPQQSSIPHNPSRQPRPHNRRLTSHLLNSTVPLPGWMRREAGRMDEIEDCTCEGCNPNCMHCSGTGMRIRGRHQPAASTEPTPQEITETPPWMPPAPTTPPPWPTTEGPRPRVRSSAAAQVKSLTKRIRNWCHRSARCAACRKSRCAGSHRHCGKHHRQMQTIRFLIAAASVPRSTRGNLYRRWHLANQIGNDRQAA